MRIISIYLWACLLFYTDCSRYEIPQSPGSHQYQSLGGDPPYQRRPRPHIQDFLNLEQQHGQTAPTHQGSLQQEELYIWEKLAQLTDKDGTQLQPQVQDQDKPGVVTMVFKRHSRSNQNGNPLWGVIFDSAVSSVGKDQLQTLKTSLTTEMATNPKLRWLFESMKTTAWDLTTSPLVRSVYAVLVLWQAMLDNEMVNMPQSVRIRKDLQEVTAGLSSRECDAFRHAVEYAKNGRPSMASKNLIEWLNGNYPGNTCPDSLDNLLPDALMYFAQYCMFDTLLPNAQRDRRSIPDHGGLRSFMNYLRDGASKLVVCGGHSEFFRELVMKYGSPAVKHKYCTEITKGSADNKLANLQIVAITIDIGGHQHYGHYQYPGSIVDITPIMMPQHPTW